MRKTILYLIFSSSFSINAQIDYSKLVVGRTTGEQLMHDGAMVRTFGFAETLSEDIKVPGPTIEVTEGDSIEFDFWNVSQGAPHTIHLHGLDVNQENDGVPSLSFEVLHMEHGFYKFKAPHPGTYIYHCHVVSTIHVQAGMYGVIIVQPSNGNQNQVWNDGEIYARDLLWTSSEIDTNWHTLTVLDHNHSSNTPHYVPADYAPQYFMINGESETQLSQESGYYYTGQNEKVYMRLVNIGYYGVRYIFPSSLNATTIASDGRPLPSSFENDTIEVLPGERYGTMIETGTDILYPVVVEYFNLNNQVVESSQNVIIKTSPLGIETENITGLKVTPNPSGSGVFNINSDILVDYSIYSILGELIIQGNSSAIDLSDEPNGMYFLQTENSIQKLIKK